MYNSLEVRAPFVDRRVVQHALTLPDSVKVKRGMNKPALVDAFRADLEPASYSKPKRGFVLPLHEWMRDSITPESSNELAEPLNVLGIMPEEDPFSSTSKGHLNPKEQFTWLVLSKWLRRNGRVLSVADKRKD
jgi:asparagine synthase (glutamine-hydrolysing)